MKRNGLHQALGVLALCVASLAAQAQQQSGYSLKLVGNTYPNDLSRQFGVSDVSDRGDLTGSRGLPNGDSVAFVWRNGVFRDLNARVSAPSASANAINDSLDIALIAEDAPLQRRAYILRGTGQLIAIAPPQGRRMAGIGDMNNRRQVLVTTSDQATGLQTTALWQGGGYSRLEPLPGSSSTAVRRLNDVGVVVGSASSLSDSKAVLWQNGTIMPLPKPQGASSVSGIDISNDGTVLMHATFPAAPVHTSVVLWKEGQLTVLKSLPGLTWAEGSDISNRNVIVGRSFNGAAPSTMTATLWRAGRPTDLNARVLSDDPLKPFVHLQWGRHISDWGYIVASGVDSRFTDGRVGIYLLTPH
jgi:hypothetical protein